MKKTIFLALLLLITIVCSKLNIMAFPFAMLLLISMIGVYFYRSKFYDNYSKESRNILFISYLLYSFSLMVSILLGEEAGQIILISEGILFALILLLSLRYFFKAEKIDKKEQQRLIRFLYYKANLIVGLLLVVNGYIF
tara:strand:+ start:19 stop:435 length:417 start_codon:yes stop_codon:yes gene_type:complete